MRRRRNSDKWEVVLTHKDLLSNESIRTFGEDTKPYRPDLPSKEYTAFCKMNGFECTFHDLRHTFATFMIGAGMDVRAVASYLSHFSVSMTLNTYADVDSEAKMSAVDKIEAAFGFDGF